MNRDLHPHQARAIDLLRQSLAAGRRRPMLQAPTGFGKTVVAAAITERALGKHRRVLFVVPALSLIEQTIQMFWSEGIRDIGVIQADHAMTAPDRPIQIASVQTLHRRKLPGTDVVLIDEAHRWYDFYGAWMQEPAWAHVPFIGLSATPWTLGLGRYYDDLIIAATTADLIDAGYLAPFRVFAPSHPDLSEVRIARGDYHEGDLGKVMSEGKLVADVVSTWLRRAENRSTLCFAVNRAHAKHLQAKFAEAGVPTGYVDAYTSLEERETVREQFSDGRLRVVCNVGCLTTGVDWDVRCIILARPTKSEILFVQIIGRGLRTAEGTEDCLILDHSDTHLRLGFVTDIHQAELDDGRVRQRSKPRNQPLPKECPQCAFLKPPRVTTCPVCGFKPIAESKIECADGELRELRPAQRRGAEMSHEARANLFGQLKGYGREHGYKPGWAACKFREKTGDWPKGLKSVPELEPTAATRSWIRSRQIAWAMSRGGGHALPA